MFNYWLKKIYLYKKKKNIEKIFFLQVGNINLSQTINQLIIEINLLFRFYS